MDNLIKFALDNDVVNFVKGFKAKMSSVLSAEKDAMTRKVVADMAGTEVMERDLTEAVLKIKTDKGDVEVKGDDTIEHEAKPGVVRVGMAGSVLKKGVKFKKGGKWMVVKSIKESVLNESIKSELDRFKADEMKRKGKLVTLVWKDAEKMPGMVKTADEMKAKLKRDLKDYMDKIKFIGASAKGKGVEAEIELK